MSNVNGQYQSEFLTDLFKEDQQAVKAAKPRSQSGILRCVLLFGSAVLALTLVIVPVLSEKANKQSAQALFPTGVDMMSTGSIQRDVAPEPLKSGILGKSGSLQ